MTDGLVDGLTFDTFTSKTRRLGGLGLVSSDSSNSRPPLRPQLTFLIHKHLKGPKALTTGDLLRDPSIRTNVISKQQLLSRCWLFQIGFNHLRDPKTAARRPTLLGAKIRSRSPPRHSCPLCQSRRVLSSTHHPLKARALLNQHPSTDITGNTST